MKVEVKDYGFREDLNKCYMTYRVYDLNQEWIAQLKSRIEDELKEKAGELYITLYFEKDYFPLASEESAVRREDFIAREEIEMTAYLLGLLED